MSQFIRKHNFKTISLFICCLFALFSCRKNSETSDDSVIRVGQEYGGGIIFYVDGSGQHGLIASTRDLSVKTKWADSCCKTNAIYTGIGRGIDNTSAIVSAQGAGDYAASLCSQLVLQGYSDWFLPSKNELNLLYQQRDFVGGFSTDYYWSSSEHDSIRAWYLYFPYGPQYYTKKDSAARVRPIRAF
ncbi:MAG: DUF1566 domain-containing protein [Bacteroidia bacterium]